MQTSEQSYIEVASDLTIEDLRAGYWAYYFKKRRGNSLAVLVVSALLLLFGLYRLFTENGPASAFTLVSTFLGALSLIFLFLRVFITADRAMDNIQKSNLPTHTIRRFSATGIESQNEQAQSVLRWDQISGAYLHKGRLVLFYGNNLFAQRIDTLDANTVDALLTLVRQHTVLK